MSQTVSDLRARLDRYKENIGTAEKEKCEKSPVLNDEQITQARGQPVACEGMRKTTSADFVRAAFRSLSQKRARESGMDDRTLIPARRGLEDLRRFRVGRKVSEGVYGVVYHAEEEIDGVKKHYAIKAIKRDWMEGSNGTPDYLLREFDYLHRLNHPNIMCGRGIAIAPLPAKPDERRKGYVDALVDGAKRATLQVHCDAEAVDQVYLISDYGGRTLRSEIHRDRKRFSPVEASAVSKQILNGLLFLHNRCILHRDLKPSNILFNTKGEVKICDLGLTRAVHPDRKNLTHPVVTLMYRAPELHLGDRQYGPSLDMWSLGCIVAEMFIRHPLFPADNSLAHLAAVCNVLGPPTPENYPGFGNLKHASVLTTVPREGPCVDLKTLLLKNNADVPPDAIDFVSRLIVWNPCDRLSAEQALCHPFITGAGCAAASPDVDTSTPVINEPVSNEPAAETPNAAGGTSPPSVGVGMVMNNSDADE